MRIGDKMRIRKILWWIISFAFVSLTIYFGITLYTKADFLTNIQKYLICFIGALIVFLIEYLYRKVNWVKIKKEFTDGKKLRIKLFRIFSHFIVAILCCCMALGSYLITNVDDVINGISVRQEEKLIENSTTQYYAYTYVDSPVTSLGDSFSTIGIVYAERGALYNPFVTYMQNTYSKVVGTSYDFANYLSMEECVNGIYNHSIDLILISQDMYYDIIAYDSTFISKTVRIGTVELTNAVESKPVNVTSESFNVLLLGVDIRENEGTIKTDSRCDSIMIASFNPNTMEISLVSIPRDSYVLVNGVYDKITHSGNQGIATVISTVENLLGIEINYYAKFNFKALVDIVDALGGVDVDVLYSFEEMDSNDTVGAISLEEGYQHLNGEQALAYARHRKTVTDSKRANAQQQILQATMSKLVSFSTVSKIKSLFNAVGSNMMTNMSTDEIYSLMTLAPKLGEAQFSAMVIGVEEGSTIYFPQYNSNMYTCEINADSLAEAKQQIQNVFD